MSTLLAVFKVTDARLDVILAGGLYHRFPWRHLPPPPPPGEVKDCLVLQAVSGPASEVFFVILSPATVTQLQAMLFYDHFNFIEVMNKRHHTIFTNNYDIFQ